MDIDSKSNNHVMYTLSKVALPLAMVKNYTAIFYSLKYNGWNLL